MPRQPYTARPDIDNLGKSVLDALTGIVLTDDAVVYDGRLSKWIAAGDEQPHVSIELTW